MSFPRFSHHSPRSFPSPVSRTDSGSRAHWPTSFGPFWSSACCPTWSWHWVARPGRAGDDGSYTLGKRRDEFKFKKTTINHLHIWHSYGIQCIYIYNYNILQLIIYKHILKKKSTMSWRRRLCHLGAGAGGRAPLRSPLRRWFSAELSGA